MMSSSAYAGFARAGPLDKSGPRACGATRLVIPVTFHQPERFPGSRHPACLLCMRAGGGV